MTTWGDFERWSKEKPWEAAPVPPRETLHNYLFKAVLTGNASLVVKALLAGADPNAPCSTQARAHLVQNYDDNLFQSFEGTAVEFGFLITHLREYRSLVLAALVFFGDPRYRFRRDPYRSFATPGVYRQTDFYARDPGVDVSDWDVYRFNDLRGPTSLWHYTESEASGDESEADDASHATGSTQ